MLTTITFSTFEATCVAYIRDHSNSITYLQMLGSHSATNAIWAKLSGLERNGKKWKYTSEVKIGGEALALAEGIHYKTFRREQPSKLINLVLVHPSISGKSEIEPYYVLAEEDDQPKADRKSTRLNSSHRL